MNNQYTCPNCGTRFDSVKDLVMHECSADGNDEASCDLFLYVMHLSIEKTSKHSINGPVCFACDAIDKPFYRTDSQMILCKDCFSDLRTEFLQMMRYQERSLEVLPGYGLISITNTNTYWRCELYYILLTAAMRNRFMSKEDEERKPTKKWILVETDRGKVHRSLHFHDLAFWDFQRLTHLYIENRIHEILPGYYVLVKEGQK